MADSVRPFRGPDPKPDTEGGIGRPKRRSNGWTEEGRARVIAANKDRRGAKNPNYKHGNRRAYKTFTVVEKGETCCRVCGSTDRLAAHHAVPRSIGTEESRYDLRNCLPLCFSCHRLWHAGYPISRSVFTAEEWEYIANLPLIGREVLGYLDKHYPISGPNLITRGFPTHCIHGHEWTPENTYIVQKTGARQCIECRRENERRARAARRAS